MKAIFSILLIGFCTTLFSQVDRHDKWDYRKAEGLQLWPNTLSFLYENDEIGQRYVNAKIGYVNDGRYYLYDLDKNSVFRFSHTDIVDYYQMGAQLNSHYYEMPVIERVLSPEFIESQRELWPEEVEVLVGGSSTKWTHGKNQYLGSQPDIVRQEVSNAFGYLDKGDIFHVTGMNNNILQGYRETNNGKQKPGYYYAPFTDLQEQVKSNFRTLWKNKFAQFGSEVTYERVFKPSTGSYFQYVIVDPEKRVIEIFAFGYDERGARYISTVQDVSYEMMDYFHPEPIEIYSKSDDKSHFYPVVRDNFFFTHYFMPVPEDWYVNDSTFTIERSLKNWYTPPLGLSLDPPILHDTEKWVLFEIPSHWGVKEVKSSAALYEGKTDHFLTMYNEANIDTLYANITLAIRAKPESTVPQTVIEKEEDPSDGDNLQLERVFVLENVKFKQSTAIMIYEGEKDLLKLANYLKIHEDLSVELKGHTDSNGNEQANILLSQERVDFVIDELQKFGIKKKRLFGKGFGSSVPVASNETEEGRQKNRRVEFVLHQ